MQIVSMADNLHEMSNPGKIAAEHILFIFFFRESKAWYFTDDSREMWGLIFLGKKKQKKTQQWPVICCCSDYHF